MSERSEPLPWVTRTKGFATLKASNINAKNAPLTREITVFIIPCALRGSVVKKLMKFKVIPISSEITEKARRSLVSPQYKSLKAFVDVATGYGPCRSCLKTFREGEEKRLFFTYNAFDGLAELPDPGPVFIHHQECPQFDEDLFPPDLRDLPLLFEAYNTSGDLVTRKKAVSEDIENQVTDLLAAPSVDYLHIRNSEAGCFIARIEPVG